MHVEFGGKIAQRGVELVDCVEIPKRSVERTDNVVAYPLGIVGLHLEPDALEHVARKLATGSQSLHHLIQYSALAHTVYAAEDIHLAVEIPHYVALAAPQRVDLYLFNVFGVFHLHIYLRCVFVLQIYEIN